MQIAGIVTFGDHFTILANEPYQILGFDHSTRGQQTCDMEVSH